MMDRVQHRAAQRGLKPKTVFLPHCTWDKLGDILANAGGRCMGLFDELLSFFSTMNMYSSVKMQVSDTKEYQDFLQMYTGKAKTRETLGGNANFRMTQTSFTLLGFTQLQAALPIIEDIQNNAKGFTSRVLWLFPEPVYCRMQDSMLTSEESERIKEFQEQLVEALTDLYIEGEEAYTIEEGDKLTTVIVDRSKFVLSEEARSTFETIHDGWEMTVCKKYPHDALVGGLYSRGKSHVLRMSVAVELLLSMCADAEEDDNSEASQNLNPETPEVNDEHHSPSPQVNDPKEENDEETNQNSNSTRVRTVGPQAINVAYSIVNACLSQLCALNDKMHVLKTLNGEEDSDQGQQVDQIDQSKISAFGKLYSAILLSPGDVISLPKLTTKGLFRPAVNGISGRQLMLKVLDDLVQLNLGEVQIFTTPGNYCQVHFFKKRPIPTEKDELDNYIHNLALMGIALPRLQMAIESNNEESMDHKSEYQTRKNNHTTPSKKRKRDKEE